MERELKIINPPERGNLLVVAILFISIDSSQKYLDPKDSLRV